MIIVITGGPATGKTAVAKIVAKTLKAKVLNEKTFCRKNKIGSVHTGELVVDPREFEEKLSKYVARQKDLVVEGHMISNVKLPADYVFVLRTSLPELEHRLSQRFYSETKIWDNVIVEGLDYCKECAQINYEKNKVFEVDTTGKSPAFVAKKITDLIKGKGKGDEVDWSKELEKKVKKSGRLLGKKG